MRSPGAYRVRRACKICSGALAIFFTAPILAFAEGAISVIPDSSVIIQIINFIVLIGILNMVLYRPIRGMLKQRKEKMEGLENSISRSEDDAKEKGQAFEDGIKQARAKGLKEKDALLQAAAEEEKKIIDTINQKAQENLVEIRETVSRDAEKVRASLKKEIDTFAEGIGEKILGRAI